MSFYITRLKAKPFLFKSLLFVFCAFTAAWLLTYFSMRGIWGNILKPLNPLILIGNFFLPLCALLVFAAFVSSKEKRFTILVALFAFLLVFALLNIFLFDMHLMNYGDQGTLSGMISHFEVFPRWLLGTGLLGFIVRLVSPIFGNISEIQFVRVMSCLVMCISSIILILRHSNQLSILLSLTTPIWLLFCSGYDEYYPFIAPVFVFFLLLISEKWLQKFNPLIMGIIIAVIGLFYAGFLPLSVFLLLVYTILRGIKKGAFAALFSLLTALVIILIFYRNGIVDFPGNYVSSLNLEGTATLPGKTFEMTPFYNFSFAFSLENFKRIFFQFFWSGSFPYLLILIGSFGLFNKQGARQTNLIPFLFLGLFLLWQAVYYIFMIPYLGTIGDIDIFFTVYLTFAFSAGWLVDKITENYRDETRIMVKNTMIAFCTGSSAMVMVYFMFLGLYAMA